MPLVRLCRIVGNPAYRSEWMIKRSGAHNLFQPYGLTFVNRYPGIFNFVTERLSEVATPRVLSFGCATGAEVFTLRRYLPGAEIVGIDINSRSIAKCKKQLRRMRDQAIRFELASSTEMEADACYDAIFCMAVLRHGDLGASRAENCSELIRFADFERTVTGLARCLKPGGYLTIRHTNFRFSDTSVAENFDVILDLKDKPSPNTPIYGPDNRLLVGAVYTDVVFRKRKIDDQAAGLSGGVCGLSKSIRPAFKAEEAVRTNLRAII